MKIYILWKSKRYCYILSNEVIEFSDNICIRRLQLKKNSSKPTVYNTIFLYAKKPLGPLPYNRNDVVDCSNFTPFSPPQNPPKIKNPCRAEALRRRNHVVHTAGGDACVARGGGAARAARREGSPDRSADEQGPALPEPPSSLYDRTN